MLDREHRPGEVANRFAVRPCDPKRRLERALLSVGQRFSHPSHREALGRLLRAACAKPKRAGAMPAPAMPALAAAMTVTERYFRIETPFVDRHAGSAARPGACQPAIRRTADSRYWAACRMAFFDDIALAADWYTGDCVFEAPGEHKITDLEWCEGAGSRMKTMATSRPLPRIETPQGPDRETPALSARPRRGSNSICSLPLGRLGQGRLAAWAFHLLPDAFDQRGFDAGHHQWRRAREHFPGRPVDRPRRAGVVPGFVQPRLRHDGRLGGDRRRQDTLRIEVDRATRRFWACSPIGVRRQIILPDSAFGAGTRRHPQARTLSPGPRRFRFSVSAI